MKSIITNRKVDITKSGEPCLVMRTITCVIKENGYKKFVVINQRCNYYEEEIPVIDDSENAIIDAVEKKSFLRVIDKKDEEDTPKFYFSEINEFYDKIKSQIPKGLSKMETENLEEQYALLFDTKEKNENGECMYGTKPEDWELLN